MNEKNIEIFIDEDTISTEELQGEDLYESENYSEEE